MRDDLENYKKIAQMSKDFATMYSPFTPLQQYKREYLMKLPSIKSEIIDLKGAMQETSEAIDKLNKRISELEKLNLQMNIEKEAVIHREEELIIRIETLKKVEEEGSQK